MARKTQVQFAVAERFRPPSGALPAATLTKFIYPIPFLLVAAVADVASTLREQKQNALPAIGGQRERVTAIQICSQYHEEV